MGLDPWAGLARQAWRVEKIVWAGSEGRIRQVWSGCIAAARCTRCTGAAAGRPWARRQTKCVAASGPRMRIRGSQHASMYCMLCGVLHVPWCAACVGPPTWEACGRLHAVRCCGQEQRSCIDCQVMCGVMSQRVTPSVLWPFHCSMVGPPLNCAAAAAAAICGDRTVAPPPGTPLHRMVSHAIKWARPPLALFQMRHRGRGRPNAPWRSAGAADEGMVTAHDAAAMVTCSSPHVKPGRSSPFGGSAHRCSRCLRTRRSCRLRQSRRGSHR